MEIATHDVSATAAQDVVLVCGLHCVTTREAVVVAEELRARPGVRVGICPSPLRTTCSTGWLVQLTMGPLALSAEGIARAQAEVEAAVERWPSAWFLGWRIAAERPAPRCAASRRRPRSSTGRGQREAVLASLICRPQDRLTRE